MALGSKMVCKRDLPSEVAQKGVKNVTQVPTKNLTTAKSLAPVKSLTPVKNLTIKVEESPKAALTVETEPGAPPVCDLVLCKQREDGLFYYESYEIAFIDPTPVEDTYEDKFGKLPDWAMETLSREAASLCGFCLRLENVIFGEDDEILRLICESCRCVLNNKPENACACGTPKWISPLGEVAKLCSTCAKKYPH
jgi:hypothetical protein